MADQEGERPATRGEGARGIYSQPVVYYYVEGVKGEACMTRAKESTLLNKLRTLPPERLAEAEDFIDFLCARGQEEALTRAATKLAEPAFDRVWDNPDDADYDRL
jgi:hypothetical protein